MKKVLLFLLFVVLTFFLGGCDEKRTDAPTGFRIVQKGNSLVLSWNHVYDADEYRIENTSTGWKTYTHSSSVVDENPQEGTNYYELRATGTYGWSNTVEESFNFRPQVPDAPTGLAISVSTSYIELTWNAVSGKDILYNIYRSTSASGTYSLVSYTYELKYKDEDVVAGTTYFYKVSAENNYGESKKSSYVSGKIEDQAEPEPEYLPAPTGFTLTQTSSYVKLSWNKVNGAAGYAIYRALPSDEKYSLLDATTSLSYLDYDVSSGTTYYYAVAAYDSEYIVGYGSEDYITFEGDSGGGGGTSKPSTPSGLSASANSSCIELSWNSVSGASYYNIYRSTSASSSYTNIGYTASTSYEDCSVSKGTTYYYKVSAENNAGESALSSYVSAKVNSGGGGGGTALPAPTGVTATAGSYSITVSWNSVSGAYSYYVYRSTSQYSGFSKVSTEYSTSYIDATPTSGTTYYYKVAAVSSNGTIGTLSSVVSAQIGGGGGGTQTKLDTPTNLQAYSDTYYVQISFDEVSLCTSYDLYRSTSPNSGYKKITASGGSSGSRYVLTDSNPVSGTSYYKVKAIATDALKTYYNIGDSDLSSYVKVVR